MLKNELEKTTTGRGVHPPGRLDRKWTTHRVLVKFCIKDILEYKQSANKPLQPPGMLSMCASVFINIVLLLNKAFLVIAWG